MLTVAYLANQFPSPVEPYVAEEIAELRSRGVRVVPGTVRQPRTQSSRISRKESAEKIVIRPVSVGIFLKALWLCSVRGGELFDLLGRILFQGRESLPMRIKALAHTFLGACYAAQLKPREIDHIHVHHGYYGSWIGMVAARMLGVDFSLTLHGSDLLLHGAYLDTKLKSCRFCLTVSDYNRRYILQHYPSVDPGKVMVARLGVTLPGTSNVPPSLRRESEITLVAVGRLHKVKDHAFLLRSCAQLRARGLRLECLIAGEGPERKHLESLIKKYGLEETVSLLGHISGEQMDSLYSRADVVVLTSRSEGVPLVLMEAMARSKIVLAPAITGIPELVVDGKSGFLYQPGSQGGFVARLLLIHSLLRKQELRRGLLPSAEEPLHWVRHGAQVQVRHNFNRQTNLESFADSFLHQVSARTASLPHEDFVLQQI
ncbi:MAG: glycosyltransferase [Candidatus Sulfotelmatobacter sp.]